MGSHRTVTAVTVTAGHRIWMLPSALVGTDPDPQTNVALLLMGRTEGGQSSRALLSLPEDGDREQAGPCLWIMLWGQ